MTHIVGRQDRSEFIRDSTEAWRRGAVLDKMGSQLVPARPRGVLRARHSVFNALDDQRQLEIARALNGRPSS